MYIYGAKKSGGSGRVAQEAANTLKSKQEAEVIELISEGEIEGLVNGVKSVFLDDVPLVESTGEANFAGYTLETRIGTQNQSPLSIALKGNKVTESTPFGNTQIKYGPANARVKANIGTPSQPYSKVDVEISIPALTYQNPENGDLLGNSVSFIIYYKPLNGSWIVAHSTTISGKCTATYKQAYEIDLSALLPSQFPIEVKVERTKGDASTVNIQDKIYWSAITYHMPDKLSYPNSALVGITLDSENFQSIPTRGYEIKGIKVKIPVNYNPITRVYTGVWDGTFKVAWTDNPAWIFYDLVTNTRYGLGSSSLTEDLIDKWNLYSIARYCDELVPNGFGGTEPRYTCNIYISSQDEAYRVLSNIASIFRAMQFWTQSHVYLSADRPKDPVAQFSPANVIDGVFSYSGSSLKTRHTVALVTWNDPQDQYKQRIEYVEDTEGLRKYGVVQTDIIAVGCTSQGQAHRLGKWALYSERMETETVSFKIGIEYATVLPGDVIKTTDPFRAGNRYGGRIQGFEPGNTTIYLDGNIPNGNYSISIFNPTYDSTTKTNKAGLSTTVGVVQDNAFYVQGVPLSNVQINDLFVLTQTGVIEPETWRVITIQEDTPTTAAIVALEYRKDKFDAVEKNVQLTARPTSLIDYGRPAAPYIDTFTVYNEQIYVNGTTYTQFTGENTWKFEHLYYSGPGTLSTAVTFSWSGTTPKYLFKLSTDNITWEEYEVTTPTITIYDVPEGTAYVEVIGINQLNRKSSPLERTVEILGKKYPPQNVLDFNVEKSPIGLVLNWYSNLDTTKFTYPDLDLAGYELREFYIPQTSTIPAGKLYKFDQNNKLVWKTLAESGLTQAQYLAAMEAEWSSASLADNAALTSCTYIDISASVGVNGFLVKAKDTSGNLSSVPSITGIMVNGPGAVDANTIQYRVDGQDLVITWGRPSNADLGISYYIVNIDKYQNIVVYTEEFRRECWFTGAKTITITPYDISKNEGTATQKSLSISDGSGYSVRNLNYSIIDDLATEVVANDSFKLVWDAPASGSLPAAPIEYYEIRSNQNTGQIDGLISRVSNSTYYYISKVTWGGEKTLWVYPRFTTGTYALGSFVNIPVVSPGKPSLRQKVVVDNNLLLYWTAPTTGTLPIDHYLLKRGTDWATAELIGPKSGGFTSVFETIGGTYTYLLAAVDTAGNEGIPLSIEVLINQPPDYVLNDDFYSIFTGTKTNAYSDTNNDLFMPVNVTETWQSHFTSRSWDQPQDQVSAGYSYYIQPTPSTATYTETKTYGSPLAGSTITLTISQEEIISGGTTTYLIETSNGGTTWKQYPQNTLIVYEDDSFDRVRITITKTGGLIRIFDINIKLDSKLKTASGSINCLASSSGGDIVYLTNNKQSNGTPVFIDVQAIIVSPGIVSGKQPIAVYDFQDTPVPTSFKILLYDSTTGLRMDGTCSYTVRGV